MRRYDDALAACNRALDKAYGAPKASLYLTKAKILEDKGDGEAARQAYADGIAFAKTLPEPVAKPAIEALEKARKK